MANEFGLTERQERFCQEIVSDPKGIATTAAIRAGYSAPGAAVEASKNLRKPKIVSRINDLRMESLRASGYDKEKVRELILRRLTAIVSTSITDVVNISPNQNDPNRQEVLDTLAEMAGGQTMLDFGEMLFAPTTGMTEDTKSAIKSIKLKQATRESPSALDVDMHDVISAAKLLAEIAGIKEADTSLTINFDAASITAEAEARRQALLQSNTGQANIEQANTEQAQGAISDGSGQSLG